MSKYPMSHVLMERKCLDTSVRKTLVWVTGDPHPTKYLSTVRLQKGPCIYKNFTKSAYSVISFDQAG
jgi:hypothetical protein